MLVIRPNGIGCMEELGYDVDVPILIFKDNKGVVNLSLNPVTGRKSKHIPLKFHVIRNYVENEDVEIIWTPSREVLADGLTKPYARIKLENFVPGLGLV